MALVDRAVGVLIRDGVAEWGRYVGVVFGMELMVDVCEDGGVVEEAPLLVIKELLRRETMEAELMLEVWP